MNKTVAEVAADLKISKQALEKRLRREPLKSEVAAYIQTVDGVKHIADIGQSLILEHAEKNKSKTKKDTSTDADTDTSIDADIVEFLKKQLIEKDKQIERLQMSLDLEQQQILQAKQQILMLQQPKPSFFEKIFGSKMQN